MAHVDRWAHIYLSPHLDDAVLSCGGRIRQQARAGESVAVVTVFAGAPEPDAPLSSFAEELHKRWGRPIGAVDARQEEDREALFLLGAEAIHWRYWDCIYRRAPGGGFLYASEDALWGEMSVWEANMVEELSRRIAALPLLSDGRLYAPLAVGRHVDHRVVRRAAEGCRRTLIYYEDFPYAADPGCVKAVLAEGGWNAELVPLTHEGLQAKIAAIARYRSQVDTFWDSTEEMAASVRVFAERTGHGMPAERYWRVNSS